MDKKHYSQYFKAFSDETRLTIMELLARKDMTVNEITARVGLAQPTISRHLSILRQSDVVVAKREGQHVVYSLNRDKVGICCSSFCNCLEIVPRIPGRKKK